MLQEMLKTKDKVRWILESYPSTRDSDSKLQATYWSIEVSEFNKSTLEAREFLNLMWKEKLTSAESIRRCRQKLQEEDESLRGQKYYNKQENGKLITKQIKHL